MRKKSHGFFSIAQSMGMSVGALAVENQTVNSQENNTAQTKVTYDKPETWTITIPATITLNAAGKNSDNEEIEVTNISINDGNQLNFKATSANAGVLKIEGKDTNTEISYTLNEQTLEQTDGGEAKIIGSIKAGEGNTKNISLNFEANLSNLNVAGNFSDTITFTVASEEA